MSTQKNIDKICVAAVVLAMIIAVVFMNGEKLGLETLANEDRETYAATDYFTSNDLNSAEMDFSDAVKITLDGKSASISGNGAYVLYNTVRIVKSGYYSISGESDQLQIVVDAEDYSKIWIELNGVTLSCADDACLQVEKADKVFLVLKEGTQNSFTSGSEYSEDAVSSGHDGAVFAREDLTITGSGSLSVEAGYKHGIVSNDALVITGGNITVKAASDGLHANDSVRICKASLSIEAGDEGIQADEEGSEVYIESGTLSIRSTGDSIKSPGDLKIQGGEITIESEDDGIRSDTAVCIYGGTIVINKCYEGIEAKNIEIHGGDITIYPEDDGINANGGSGDMFGMNFGGGPGGFSPDSGTTETEGETTNSSPEENSSKPSFDPASFSPNSESVPESGTKTAEETAVTDDTEESETTQVLITGGKIRIVNETAVDADGIDSNGDVIITGGDIRVFLNGSGTNNAIDYGSESGGVATISGGTLIASGSYNMAESFDSSSEQVSIMYNISSGIEAGTEMTLKDADGNVLISETIPCSFTSIIISCPEMAVGNTCTLSFGDMEEAISVEEVSASYGDVQSSMFGGTMNFGGMRRREDNSSFPSMSEDGTFPEMPEDGSFPTLPEMSEDGSFPQMPENGEFQGGPDMSEGFPGSGGFSGTENNGTENNGTDASSQSGDNKESRRPSRPGNGERPNGGGRPDFQNGSTDSSETSGTMPDFQNGKPDSSETGETAEPNTQKTPASSEQPEQSFQKPDTGMAPDQQGGGPGFGNEAAVTSEDTETAAETTADPTAVMVLTGASVLILLAGIVFAKLFKGKHISA